MFSRYRKEQQNRQKSDKDSVRSTARTRKKAAKSPGSKKRSNERVEIAEAPARPTSSEIQECREYSFHTTKRERSHPLPAFDAFSLFQRVHPILAIPA